MATTYELIAKSVLTSNTATVTFSDIPGTFSDLYIHISGRCDRVTSLAQGAYGYLTISLNGSTANFSSRTLLGTGTSAISQSLTSNRISYSLGCDNQTADTFGSIAIYIPNYAGSTNKSISATGVNETNSSASEAALISEWATLWSNTAAITSVAFATETANSNLFKSGSSFFLYGITKA